MAALAAAAWPCAAACAQTPLNDTCLGAIDINAAMTGASYLSAPVVYGAAFDDDNLDIRCDQSAGNLFANNGVWWKYTAGATAERLTIGEPGPEDVAFSIWIGAGCDQLAPYACAGAGGSVFESFGVNIEAGRTCWILVSRWGISEPAPGATVVLSVHREAIPAVPVNDRCEAAVDLTSRPLPLATNNIFPLGTACNDAGADPACDDAELPCASFGVWFTYTVGSSGGRVGLSDSGPDDLVFSVWTGSCDALVPVVCADGGAADSTSFYGSPGTTYRVLVSKREAPRTATAGTPALGATITLGFDFTPGPPPPANDLCAAAVEIAALPFESGPVFTSGAISDELDVPCDATLHGPIALRGVWFAFTTPPSPGAAIIRERWPFDTCVSLWTGGCDAPAAFACDDAAVDAPGGWTIGLTESTRYLALVSQASAVSAPITEAVGLSIEHIAIPENDACESAFTLLASAMPASFTVHNQLATPDIDAGPCTPSVQGDYGTWWTFTPPTAGTLFIHEASLQDSVVGVFTGSCESLATAQCSVAEINAFAVQAGVAYRVLLAAQTGAVPASPLRATFAFFPAIVANDACESAMTLSGAGSFLISNRGAATNAADSAISCLGSTTAHHDVWYRWVAPAGGLLGFAANSNPTPVSGRLAVYASIAGACPIGASPLACAAAADPQSIAVNAGETCFLRFMSTASGATGEARIELRFAPDLAAIGACCVDGACALTAAGVCTGAFHGVGSLCAPSGAAVREYSGFGGSPPSGQIGASEAFIELPVIVPDHFRVADVEVAIDVAHSFIGDLTITLSKEDRSIRLVERVRRGSASNAGSNNNFGAGLTTARYTFADSASTTVWNVANTTNTAFQIPPGAYRPQAAGNIVPSFRSTFNGKEARGIWTLRISSFASGATAAVGGWTLRLTEAGSFACDASIAQVCCRGSTCSILNGTCPPPGTLSGIGTSTAAGPDCTGTTIAGCCHADFDHSGQAAISDIFAYLNAWFAGSPFARFGGDGTGVPVISDIFAFLNGWFAGCG